jgi:hypothetical protein
MITEMKAQSHQLRRVFIYSERGACLDGTGRQASPKINTVQAIKVNLTSSKVENIEVPLPVIIKRENRIFTSAL